MALSEDSESNFCLPYPTAQPQQSRTIGRAAWLSEAGAAGAARRRGWGNRWNGWLDA